MECVHNDPAPIPGQLTFELAWDGGWVILNTFHVRTLVVALLEVALGPG
jgi:hypothetical protein